MDAQTAAVFGDTMGQQVLDLQKTEEQTRAQLAEAASQIAQQREAMLKALTARVNRSSPLAWPPKVVAIANTLTLQPRLVEPVDQFLQRLVAKINAAVDQAVTESLFPAPPSSPPEASS